MDKLHDVVVVGELNVDLILNQIDQFPQVGKEVLAGKMNLTLGSSSAIFASNLCTLGASTSFIGKIGQDSFGDLVIDSLSTRGVDTRNIIRDETLQTGATIVLNFGEDRAMVTHPGAMEQLTLADVQDHVLKSARHLHMSSIFLQPGLIDQLETLFKNAKKLGLTTSIDPQWDPAERWAVDLEALLSYVDVFMPNAGELMAFTKTSNLQSGIEVLKPYANILVVKDGRAGAYGWQSGELIHQPPFLNEQVVDSIGAGDSFDAGFISMFIQGKTLQECLSYGALSGAVNTTRPGGTTAFATFSLFKSIAETNFNYTFA